MKWKPAVDYQDSTVYYWRVTRDSLVNGVLPWRQSSFLYLPNSSPGWNQSDFGQYISGGEFINLTAVDSSRSLAFVNSLGLISINVAYRNRERYPGLQNIYYEGFFGDAGFNGQGLTRGVALMVQDPNTGRLVPNPPNSTYNTHPTKTKSLFSFNTQDSLERIALMGFIENEIPDNYIVGLLAIHPWNDTLGYAPRLWGADSLSYGKNIFQVLEAQGAREVRSTVQYTNGPHPYGLIFQKNNPGFDAVDTLIYHIDSVLNIRREFQTKWSVGRLETPTIGPVKKWEDLYWMHKAKDDPSDQLSLSVIGVREGLPDSVLYTLGQAGHAPLQAVEASTFPRLKLQYESVDTVLRTFTQPQYLRLLYEPAPEGALDPSLHFEFYADTLQQGEPGQFSAAFINVSDSDFDSLKVRYRVENASNVGEDVFQTYPPLKARDTMHLSFQLNTTGKVGDHRFLVEANPGNDQLEVLRTNNTLIKPFYISKDQRNPLLDVTFDGLHILDGDLVSPQPAIVVQMKDENPFLNMADTNTFELHLITPDGIQKRVYISDPAVQFFPAQADQLPVKNLASLEWRPTFLQDGNYVLIVNGVDASGNPAGDLDYRINFKVITRSALSNVLNYPNPFSTSTCFVYTLTGVEIPTSFRIQIMTVSGRVVREVTEAEFGPLRPGTHRSSFCWEGRDQFGDLLANGVYLYRVVAKKADGTDYDLFENDSVDGFFQGGLGKIVIMR